MNKIVECVPNFSEGRRPEVVEALAQAITREGAAVLDRTMDADHHRSVITFAGEPEAVLAAMIAAAGVAVEKIDLRAHKGEHLRLGAVDVIPFAPVRGVTLDDCVTLANKCAAELWRKYQLPVYLYEAAAKRPERRRLELVRGKGFEAIRERIAEDEALRPDVGEAQLHETAGAAIVGARKFLIAYNVFLASDDVDIAKRIARKIRASSGGMACVKAMGVRVRGLAQVTMNLTDYETTGIGKVFMAVVEEARKEGVEVLSSELIGLAPEAALADAANVDLRIENFSREMILEERIQKAFGE